MIPVTEGRCPPLAWLRGTMIVASERIPVAAPSITEREVELAAEAARTAWRQNHYAYNARFERMLADYVGVAHAVSVPHATAALHLALAALGIGPGDEVIAPDVTWIASVAPIVYVGAEPVLVDILPDTWCLDPDAVEAAIGPRTKAILGVDLYGSTCDWERLQAIADRRGLALIEDAAEALGSARHGRKAGVVRPRFGVQLSRLEDGGHRRGRHAGDRRQGAVRPRAVPARPRPQARRPLLPQFRDRLQVPDERGAGGARRRADGAHRRADRLQAGDLRLVSRPARRHERDHAQRRAAARRSTAIGWSRRFSIRASASTSSRVMAAFDKRNIDTRPFFSPPVEPARLRRSRRRRSASSRRPTAAPGSPNPASICRRATT